ncbi:glycoside hydrolase family 3 N-terminal domain-containing protein [Aliifodinibius sp. S!AR15-10]|uniref:glycoside hydrolase family 3 protein n=1 Tax=Aliifodinibius sp. S!AR15-10 TaxID=2950437 RepID=UPI0038F67D4A
MLSVPVQTQPVQQSLEARGSEYIYKDGLQFKDLNKNGALDPYEDWRLPVQDRVDDLLSQMTIEEKAGMMLINTLNAEADGRLSDRAVRYINEEKMTRFIFRNPVTSTPDNSEDLGWGGAEITPYQAAQFMNLMQEMAESTRLGIPVLFKSNARNHYDQNAKAGINVSAGSFSEWPKEAGLAATRDMDLIADFAQTMRSEWTVIGLRSMYGYMADLATEPRWYRVHETFTEDADLATDIIRILVENLQEEKLNANSIALTLKHFPGGGPQEGGGDPHYEYGKNQAYPSGNFDYHLKPFKAAINADVSAIMPYYGIPIGQKYKPNDVGMAFSRGIVTELLRNELDFEGYVNSDTGIIGERAWGLEDQSIDEQLAVAIGAGTDVLSGFDDKDVILDLLNKGEITEDRVDISVRRLLREQFELGLFEDPFVDPDRAAYLVGNRVYQAKAEEAQRKSIVLLENKNGLLPIASPTEEKPVLLYTMGMDPDVVSHERWNGYEVVSGDYSSQLGETRPGIPEDTDYAIIRVNVINKGAGMFGGAIPEELDMLAFSDMVGAKSWEVSPSVEDIRAVMEEVGSEKTILSIYFRQPFVIDQASGMRDAGAILATFGVRDAAIMDILTGNYPPEGKLPFALANSPEAIIEQAPDAPGYPEEYTLYPFGYGLSY